MKNHYIAILVIVSIFFFNTPVQADYTHHLKIQDMDFSWTLGQENIDIQVSAKTTGWVGIGFNPESSMLGANIIIGYVKKGKVKIEDHYGHQKRAHVKDEKQGGAGHILNPSGSEENGVTTLSFSIPLDSKDAYDSVVQTDGPSTLIFAYGGKRDSLKSRHSFRTTWKIDLTSGEGEKIR